MKIYKQDLNEMLHPTKFVFFFCSLKDVGNSSRHGDYQEKTIKQSEMPEVNILYLYFKSLGLLIFFSVLVISLFLYCIDSKFHNHHSVRFYNGFYYIRSCHSK